MRGIFGLAGLLVVLGVIVMFMSQSLTSTQRGLKVKRQTEERFSMNTREGLEDARASVTLDDAMRGSKFDGLLVRSVVTGGAMDKTFGLLPGDTIIAINGLRFRDIIDPEMARAQLFEAKARNQALTVLRDGRELELKPQ